MTERRIRDIGEFNLIRALLASAPPMPADVRVGPGDDCAVWQAGDRCWMVSCDGSMEGVHFRRDWSSADAIGWKAAASALSDIAAMGGLPRFALCTAALPSDLPLEYMQALYGGLQRAIEETGAALIGGDTTASLQGIALDVTVIGEAAPDAYKQRRGARAGDAVLVTGFPGRSAAGLALLERGDGAAFPALVRAHQYPRPRIAEGQWLARQGAVRAMIDVSDGVAQDGGHLAAAASLSLCLNSDTLPDDAELRACAQALGAEAAAWSWRGGEDYELLAAVDAAEAGRLAEAFTREHGLPLTALGHFEEGPPGVFLDGRPLDAQGFQHFQN